MAAGLDEVDDRARCKKMGATIQQEGGYLRVLRIWGLLKKSELDAALAAEAENGNLQPALGC